MIKRVGRVRIGISGYDYKAWRGQFYPEGLAARYWLRYAASIFDTIELNGTFYSLKSPEVFRRWVSEVPPGFLFAVKGSRFITHNLKLRNAEAALANFYASGVLALNVTSSFVYVRLHGSRVLYTSDYTDTELTEWAARIDGWTRAGLDVYVYFDNDAKVHAPRDAVRLRGMLD